MIERFQQLSLREKQTVTIGVVCVLFFLFYSLLWAPFTTKVDTLRESVKRNDALLSFMQSTDQQIQNLSKNNMKTPAKSRGSSLSVLQNNIHQSEIATQLSDMQQKDHDAVQLNFKEVDFDKLMSWLMTNTSEGWMISEFTVTKSSKAGMVSAVIALKLA